MRTPIFRLESYPDDLETPAYDRIWNEPRQLLLTLYLIFTFVPRGGDFGGLSVGA